MRIWKSRALLLLSSGLIAAVGLAGWLGLMPRSLQAQDSFACGAVTTIPLAQCEALVTLYTSTAGTDWYFQAGWLDAADPCRWDGVECRNGEVVALLLEDNNLTGELPIALRNLTALERLDLSQNNLSGELPPALGDLVALQELNLLDNQLSGAIHPRLRLMTALRVLDLGDNRLSGALPRQLSQLGNLRQLFLNNNPGLSGEIPGQLRNVPLTAFWYQNTEICIFEDAVYSLWLDDIANIWRSEVLCDSGPPLAVTVGYFAAQSATATATVTSTINITWQTVTEAEIGGFNLMAARAEGVSQLNSELIPARGIGSLTPQTYRVTVESRAVDFYLQEVGLDGGLAEHGPFALNEEYGDYATLPPATNAMPNAVYLPLIYWVD